MKQVSTRIDFWVILGMVFVSVPIILYFQVRSLMSAAFFFVIPTLYLFFRRPKPIKRIIIGTLLIGGGIGLVFDILASANRAWDGLPSQLIFGDRLFGFYPLDEAIWFLLWVLFILVFYEHFYEREKRGPISRRFKFLAVPAFGALTVIVLVFASTQDIFRFRYAYFFLALPSIIPIAYVIRYYPNLIVKFLKTGVFFFMLYLVYEVTALKTGQWYFPGEYIGFVELAGVRFPFEELFFWMMLSSSTVLSLYEGFVDDEK